MAMLAEAMPTVEVDTPLHLVAERDMDSAGMAASVVDTTSKATAASTVVEATMAVDSAAEAVVSMVAADSMAVVVMVVAADKPTQA
jgi:hypothetical protein